MDSSSLAALTAKLLLAVQALTGYDVPAAPPDVVFLPQRELAERACGGPCKVFGWFPPGKVVYLAERLRPLDNVYTQSVLVHELVHYAQQESGVYAGRTTCRDWRLREEEAFDAQLRWVVQQRASVRTFHRFLPHRRSWKSACSDGSDASDASDAFDASDTADGGQG